MAPLFTASYRELSYFQINPNVTWVDRMVECLCGESKEKDANQTAFKVENRGSEVAEAVFPTVVLVSLCSSIASWTQKCTEAYWMQTCWNQQRTYSRDRSGFFSWIKVQNTPATSSSQSSDLNAPEHLCNAMEKKLSTVDALVWVNEKYLLVETWRDGNRSWLIPSHTDIVNKGWQTKYCNWFFFLNDTTIVAKYAFV